MNQFAIEANSARQSSTQITLMNVGFEFSRFQMKTIASPVSKITAYKPLNA